MRLTRVMVGECLFSMFQRSHLRPNARQRGLNVSIFGASAMYAGGTYGESDGWAGIDFR